MKFFSIVNCSLKSVQSVNKQAGEGITYNIFADVSADGSNFNCGFEILEQVWLRDGTKVTVNCDNGKNFQFTLNSAGVRVTKSISARPNLSRNNFVGAKTEISKNNEMANNLLRKNLKRLSTGNDGPLQVVRVDKIFSKVVTGVDFTIEGVFKNNAGERKCKVDIWYRPWLEGNDGTEISAQCEDGLSLGTGSGLGRRDGSPLEISKDDETANNLLRKNLKRVVTGNHSPLEVVRVDKIFKQVVEGEKYIIKGVFKTDDDEKRCTVSIWYRPWVHGDNGTKITAICDN